MHYDGDGFNCPLSAVLGFVVDGHRRSVREQHGSFL
jgi:hypothetical protein